MRDFQAPREDPENSIKTVGTGMVSFCDLASRKDYPFQEHSSVFVDAVLAHKIRIAAFD